MHKVLITFMDKTIQGFDGIEEVVRTNGSIVLTSGKHKFVVPEDKVLYYFIEALEKPENVEPIDNKEVVKELQKRTKANA